VIAGALAAPASGASLDAPGSVAAKEVLAVTAHGLEPGTRYGLFLSHDDAIGLPCVGRIARRIPRAGEATVFSGIVPSTLKCSGVVPSQVPPPSPPRQDAPFRVEPGGGYRLVVCIPAGRECDKVPEDRVRVHVVPTGRRCGTVVFTPNSDHGAFRVRARNVTCAVARYVAGGAIGGDPRYRRAGLRCRGTFDDGTALPGTIYRCRRPGVRVTFLRVLKPVPSAFSGSWCGRCSGHKWRLDALRPHDRA